MFQFSNPAERAPQSPRSLAVSLAVHGVAILVLFAIRFSSVAEFSAAPEHFTLIAPVKEIAIARTKIQVSPPREFRPLPSPPVHLPIPAIIVAPPPIEISGPVPEIPHAAPPLAINVPVIMPSVFAEAKPSAPAHAPKQIVKPAGFETSENSATGLVRGAVTGLGSFESVHAVEGAAVRGASARAGGFGDALSPASAASGVHRNVVSSAAFGDTSVERDVRAPRQTPMASRLTAVEILSKPRPEFTAEARTKNIEGEVLLEVQFRALGDVTVLRVVRGLGYGLDENAMIAARNIRFRPAARDGVAVDSTALVHIVFQLAN